MWIFFVPLALALAPEVEHAEVLANAGDLDGVLTTLEAYTAAHPDDPEGLWRLSRALYEKGEVMAQSMPDSARIPMYERALALAKRTEELAPEDGEGYLWEAAALGRIGTAKGILSELFIADDMERLLLRSIGTSTRYRMASGISTFPGDAWYGLGQLYRLVPDSTIIEWVAGTRGDIDKSIHYLRLLATAEPARLEGLKELGVSLLCKGYREDDSAAKAEGRMWLNRALTLPYTYPTDVIDHTQIPVILSREDEACGYSRDGWEDVDPAKAPKQ